MGGYGSGRWTWHTKKMTVEESLELPVSVVMPSIRLVLEDGSGRRGTVTWSDPRTGKRTSDIAYEMWPGPRAELLFQSRGKSYRQRVRLVSVPCHFGGQRWYWLCPGCGRRVFKIYVTHSPEFRCRTCHDLTYRSCQESHIHDRYLDFLAGECGIAGLTGEDIREALGR